MYHPKDIIEILAANVRTTRSPFGIPKPLVNTWWKGMSLPVEGGALLFTGLMYQFMPYIEKTTSYLEKFEDTPTATYVRFGRYRPKRLAGLGLALIASRNGKREANGTLRDIAGLLITSGVDYHYDPRLDFYSGILLYDLGDQEGFEEHARFVARRLQAAGVRKVITVDPHTTYALKVLYPKYTGMKFEVSSYIELVDLVSNGAGTRVTLHDPCFYGRYLEVSDAPRRTLRRLGIECVEPPQSGPFTHCCGGPAESVSPLLSREVMVRRVEQLQTTGAPIVAMCPICLGNLKRSGAAVEDLAAVLARSARAAAP
jgi:Fe-S oxidoreductase